MPEGIHRGCEALLEVVSKGGIARIALTDGPSVLGWTTWRAIDDDVGGQSLRTGLEAAMNAGATARLDVQALATFISGALNEGRMEPLSCYTGIGGSPVAWYREFAPRAALQAHIYSLFSFVPGPAPASMDRRQHLAREFRLRLGLSPKLHCRLARFQPGLAHAGQTNVDWGQAATDLGHADQSHMVAEFRPFSSQTPQALEDT